MQKQINFCSAQNGQFSPKYILNKPKNQKTCKALLKKAVNKWLKNLISNIKVFLSIFSLNSKFY